MQCPNCSSPVEDGAAFCGTCGNQIAPLHARGATTLSESGDKTILKNSDGMATRYTSQPPSPPPAQPYGQYAGSGTPDELRPSLPFTPPVPPPQRNATRTVAFIGILLVVLVISVSAGILALMNNSNGGTQGNTTPTQAIDNAAAQKTATAAAASAITGTASFSDSQDGAGQNNTVKLLINGLPELQSGSQYKAWIRDTANEKVLALGPLTAQEKSLTLNFTGQQNLLGAGNELLVTKEQGDASTPTGDIVLIGTFPEKAFVHIKHLHFSFPTTPDKIGLLQGLREQVRLLNAQALVLKSGSGNPLVVRCAAQGILNVIEGSKGTNYQPLVNVCPSATGVAKGDGFGLLGSGYIVSSAEHASLAATQSDSTPTIKTHAGHVIVATDNLKKWIPEIQQSALALLNNPDDTAKIQQIVAQAERALNGVDTNSNEDIEAIPDEGGAITAYQHGQLMEQLVLKPGS